MTDDMTESLPSTPLAVNHSPRSQNWLKNAWTIASRDAVRYNELYDFYLQMYTSEQKEEINETRDRETFLHRHSGFNAGPALASADSIVSLSASLSCLSPGVVVRNHGALAHP
jgi:hypothetical protein